MSYSTENQSPKYQQLVEQVRGQITRGELKHGDRLPSLKELRESSISRPTVEKAYAMLEREGLIVRQHGAGVFVRATVTRPRRGVIGLNGEGFRFGSYSPYWAEIMGGANEAASREGFQLLILDPATNDGWDKADGVIICDWDDIDSPRKAPPGLPLVSIMTAVNGIASVATDEITGAEMAVRHLLELGHRRIGFLHGYDRTAVARHRLKGYRQALQTAGIEPQWDWTRCLAGDYVAGARFTTVARSNMRKWLAGDWRENGCTALLCHNDEAALGAMQALEEAGIRVPEEVSVIGFDGTEFCDVVSPSLTSIALPLRQIGAAAVSMALKQIEADELTQEHKILSATLKAGHTTAPPQNGGDKI